MRCRRCDVAVLQGNDLIQQGRMPGQLVSQEMVLHRTGSPNSLGSRSLKVVK